MGTGFIVTGVDKIGCTAAAFQGKIPECKNSAVTHKFDEFFFIRHDSSVTQMSAGEKPVNSTDRTE